MGPSVHACYLSVDRLACQIKNARARERARGREMSTKQTLSDVVAHWLHTDTEAQHHAIIDAVRALETALEQALLDRDAHKATSLQLARERDAAVYQVRELREALVTAEYERDTLRVAVEALRLALQDKDRT